MMVMMAMMMMMMMMMLMLLMMMMVDDGDDGGAYSKSANAMEIGNYGGWANPRKTQGAESVTHLILWFYADPWLRKC